MARLYAAISAERVARLTKRFYERYGSVDALEGDDVLSSESEDEKESNALRIKI
jgi:truncated hemoglobin YjbI